MKILWRTLLFLLFFLSGFSGLLYQVVWTRMAFASFGIITPVLSVVLSVFMLGLAVGSWWGGKCISALSANRPIGSLLLWRSGIPHRPGAPLRRRNVPDEPGCAAPCRGNEFSGIPASLGLAIAISIFPWCVCMGTTFPFMMAYVREREQDNTGSFSFLYLANVLGAMCGTAITAVVLVEALGFHGTLWVAAAANFSIALISISLGLRSRPTFITPPAPQSVPDASGSSQLPSARGIWPILFFTGFAAMTMEVVWSRLHAGAENPGLFLRDDPLRIPGRNVPGFTDVPVGFGAEPRAIGQRADGRAGDRRLHSGLRERSQDRRSSHSVLRHRREERIAITRQHLSPSRPWVSDPELD